MGIAHPPGYPLFTMLASLLHKLPVGSPAWRINLLSVLLATASAWLSPPPPPSSPPVCACRSAAVGQEREVGLRMAWACEANLREANLHLLQANLLDLGLVGVELGSS